MTDLYRFFDKDERLLYVGISLHAAQRASSHRRDKEWWSSVARMDVQHLPPRADAREVERRAIIKEKPLYNVVHNGEEARRSRPVRAQRQSAPKHSWVCLHCDQPAVWLHTPNWLDWEAVCRDHDRFGDDVKYHIEASAWPDDEGEDWSWRRHLKEKQWFRYLAFVEMEAFCRGRDCREAREGNTYEQLISNLNDWEYRLYIFETEEAERHPADSKIRQSTRKCLVCGLQWVDWPQYPFDSFACNRCGGLGRRLQSVPGVTS